MKLSSSFGLPCLALLGPASALVGIENAWPFSPICAQACLWSISYNMLSCSSDHPMSGGNMMTMGSMTSPECYASDTSFLTTLAWCIHSYCTPDDIPTSVLDRFWETRVTGSEGVAPRWNYTTALNMVTKPPTRDLTGYETLNFTALVDKTTWSVQAGTAWSVEREESIHARYGLAILVTGFALPILLTWLGYIPYITGTLDKIKPLYLIYPSTVGTYQVRPLPYLLGNAPTLGQNLYIAVMVIINVVLTAVNYRITMPHSWFSTRYQQILAWILFRTGTFGFALFPLVLLFASRNNVLLWLTDWSHSTYMLLHRWVSRIFGLQVLIHSIVAIVMYKDSGRFQEYQKMWFWIWGSVATVACSIMLVASGLHVRKWSYEIFLITHILLAVFVAVGCWYHVHNYFPASFGYEMWLYAACAVWFFDRLARVCRVLKTGIRRARVSDAGNGVVRVDIGGVNWGEAPGRHVFVYFPTLNPLRPWENHPFSVVPTSLLTSHHHSVGYSVSSDGAEASSDQGDVEKREVTQARTRAAHPDTGTSTPGVTLFIRKSTGMTKALRVIERLPVLLDGPYPSCPTKTLMQCERLLLIGGGIGITGLLAWVNTHPNVKLFWSVKGETEDLVRAIDAALSDLAEKDVRIGQRLGVTALLNEEAEAGWERIGVVVCGPGGLCDDVRAAVVVAGRRQKAVFELEVDAFCW